MAASDDEEVNSRALMTRVLSGLRGQSARDVSLRSFSSYARSDMLSEYMSSPHASELKDDAKRKLFEHFMRVTGPSMSLYERHPFDPAEKEVSGTLGGGSNIWSCKNPSIRDPASGAVALTNTRHIPTDVISASCTATSNIGFGELAGFKATEYSTDCRTQTLSHGSAACGQEC